MEEGGGKTPHQQMDQEEEVAFFSFFSKSLSTLPKLFFFLFFPFSILFIFLRVELSLFDILGRRALTLSDQAYTAGAHTLALKADHLATGLYFVHLRSADFSTTRKLLLVR